MSFCRTSAPTFSPTLLPLGQSKIMNPLFHSRSAYFYTFLARTQVQGIFKHNIPQMPILYIRTLFVLLFLGTALTAVNGQNIRINQADQTLCDGLFYDSGGASGSHAAPGVSHEITICSDRSSGSHVELVFQSFDIRGEMTIYNGTSSAAAVLNVIDANANGTQFRVQATAGNTSGCLTVRFENNDTEIGNGWAASINCVVACQPIEAVLLSTNPAPGPDGFIDICPGETIDFSGQGNYPENGVIYPQSDARSDFTWNFQDGNTGMGQNVSNTFEDPGGYVVQLIIEDDQGCRNGNRISQRVRVSPPPIFNDPANLPAAICAGQELPLTVGRNSTGSISFNPSPQEFSFNTSQTFTELTVLPDGTGTEYSSPLLFSNFNPAQTLDSGVDLVRICASMEHSYLGDLDIWIECPDGNRLDLHRFDDNDAVRRQLLGQGNENTTTPDPPATYCWTASAPRTMAEAVVDFNIGDDQTMPSIDYAAEESFNTLVGCELNGEWTFNVRDNIARDNGSIYEWSIEFANSVYPDQETFTVPIDNVIFKNTSDLAFYSPDSIVLSNSNPGPKTITIISTDDYGCVFDTSFVLDVLPPFDPACLSCGPLVARTTMDTAICLGEDFQPNVAGNLAADTVITWESTNDAPFSNDLYRNAVNAYESEIRISSHFPDRIDDATTDILAVCVNLENNGNLRDVTLQLTAPNGRTITLIEQSGGNGEDLTQTCFTPLSTTPISSGSAPYTGDFRIESGGWGSFNTSLVNGTWTLSGWDRAGNDIGRFISWSISLRYDRQPVYRWTPANASLSCTDCPNPTITPTAPGTYTLDVTTSDGCTDQATVNVSFNVLDVMVTEQLIQPLCNGTATGSILQAVSGATGPYTYLWNDGNRDKDRTLLTEGQYDVTITDANGCTREITYNLDEPDVLSVTLDEVIDASCNGGSTGEIRVTTNGGTGPFTYLWDDPNAQNDEDAGALTAGTYNLLVTDANMCTATFQATVGEPAVLSLQFRDYAVSCRDGDDGRAVVIASGGNGGYQYSWQTGAMTDSISGLLTGNYEVTVTDQLNCSISGMVFIDQPATPITATIVQDEQGCFEASANRATVAPSGGSGGYTFLWSNGENTATATALPAGNNTVSVTDSGGCEQVFSITTQDLPELTVNILATAPSCNDRSDGQLGAVPSGGAGMMESDYTFQWSTNEAGVVITNVAGDQMYSVTVTGPRGCTGIAERFLAAPPPITFTATEDRVDCFGNSTGGLAITNINGPNAGAFQLQWGPEAASSMSPTITNLPAGRYPLRITDVGSCTVDTVLTISEPAELLPSAMQTDVSCNGETDGRIAVTGTGGTGNYQFAWSNGSNQNQITGLAAGTYTLSLTDDNACETITTYTITEPAPVGISATSTPVLCMGENTGSVTVTGSGGRPPFLFGLENQGFTRNNTFIGLPAGDYVAFVRDSAGCQISTTVTVVDGPTFSLELGQDTTIIFADSIQLTPDIIGGIDTLIYDWRGAYPGTLSCTDCREPFARPEYEIDYDLVITDGNGCMAEDRIRVSVRKIREVAVATGFSPNNDSANDILFVQGRPGTRVVSFAVYDRWSNLLFEDGEFEVNDDSHGWDGTYKGEPVNAGVYIYRMVIEYEDESRETLAGETTLIR